MPERSPAQSVHTALVLLGWAGLITAGFCFPAIAILTQYYPTDSLTAIDWLGPIGLFVGCFSALAAMFFARSFLGIPLPNGSPRSERWIAPLWVAGLILLALRCTILSGMPALIAEVLYLTYPFLIALGLSPALVMACPAIPHVAATQRTWRGSGDLRSDADH